MSEVRAKIRELFVEELAEVRGGDPSVQGRPLEDVLCRFVYTTLACGEETGPCAPTGC